MPFGRSLPSVFLSLSREIAEMSRIPNDNGLTLVCASYQTYVETRTVTT